ncbi:hypothetical protein CERSUDRAFT_114772, partial [Gelatoporia subvermispora B]
MDWFIKPSNGGFVFSAEPLFSTSWNVQNGFPNQDNPVIEFPLDQVLTNSVWIFNSTNSTSGSATSALITPSTSATIGTPTASSNGTSAATTGGSSTNTATIIGATIGSVIGAILMVLSVCWKMGLFSSSGGGEAKTVANLAISCCNRISEKLNSDDKQKQG